MKFKILIIFFIFTSSIVYLTILFFNKNNNQESITIAFAGDTMLGRLVNQQISKTKYNYIWGDLLPILHKTDINIINLETTLTNSTDKVPKVFNFKADLDKVKALQAARIDFANLANNHILDFNIKGMIETINVLDKANIKHAGAGINIEAAIKPALITKNNIKIAIFGYTDNEPSWIATNNKPGTNYIKVGDIQKIKNDISKIRNKVDIIIISIHWGPNMRQEPTQEFIDFAHAMIDAGVDIIHGHSSHIFQAIEIYKNKLILYDTGDFIDDYAIDPILRNDQSLLYLTTINKTGIKEINLIPIIISNMQVNKATGNNFHEIAQRIINLSAKFKTKIEIINNKTLKVLI